MCGGDDVVALFAVAGGGEVPGCDLDGDGERGFGDVESSDGGLQSVGGVDGGDLRGMGVRWRIVLVHGVLFAGFTVVGSAPWNVRNWFLLRPPALVFIRGNFWLEVWSSMHPVMRVEKVDGTKELEPLHPWNGTERMERKDADGVMRKLREQEYDAWCRERAVAEFRLRPGSFWRDVAVQFNAFWLGVAEAIRWGRSVTMFFLAQGVPALLGLLGLVLARKRMAAGVGAALAGVLLVFPLPYYLAGGGMRYRHPMDVVIYLGIGWLVWMGIEKWRGRSANRAGERDRRGSEAGGG